MTTYAALFDILGGTYGLNTSAGTFGLPNLINRFIQGSNSAGTLKNAGLPNITGSYDDARASPNWNNKATGAFIDTFNSTFGGDYVASGTGGTIIFNASYSNAIYGASSTVQPPSVTTLYCIKY